MGFEGEEQYELNFITENLLGGNKSYSVLDLVSLL